MEGVEAVGHRFVHAAAATYAVPREWREQDGVRRYGLPGPSHAYAAGLLRS